MKLSEKIYDCRKKNGLSQEALAEKLSVSRQAVSKWENGESDPEISKLKGLAEIFGVSIDWLLSEEEAKAEQSQSTPEAPAQWVERFSEQLVRFIKRYGWLTGVCIVLCGCGISCMGGMLRHMIRKMFVEIELIHGTEVLMEMLNQNPAYLMGGIIRMIGLAVIVCGIALAMFLKRKAEESTDDVSK